jgi:hypothetical protein
VTGIVLPPENRTLSPFTGWTRDHWAAVADHLLLSLRPFFSSTRSRVLLPGRTSSSGVHSDGLEGFARSLLLFGFRMAGERGHDPLGFTSWYREGILAGTDPQNQERWPTATQVDQAKVEAASIALALQLTRPWLWDTYSEDEKRQVADWLALAADGWYPDNNWLWFRITVETFLASVGGRHDPGRVENDLATIESYYRADGWYADGRLRAFDYYCGWAMHVYPLLWTVSAGSEALGAGALAPVFRNRLADFLDDYACLVGADGMPVLQGRSLIYRFATAAPLWMGAVTGATRLSPGRIRRAASGMLRAFVDRDGIDEHGLLTVGLFGEWPAMAQSYSGAGSPYWASKGMLGLMLPADHPVWQAVEEPLPVEVSDFRRVIRPAGWIVSGTASDGVVRVINHGTDHAMPGDRVGDSALYARFGYSSATIPPLLGETIDSPVDNSTGLVDPQGRTTHRTGFEVGPMGDDSVAAFAGSSAVAHWVDSTGITAPDHGSGRAGTVIEGPALRSTSVVRGAWEVRSVVLGKPEGEQSVPVRLRVSGWPVSGDQPLAVVGPGFARAECAGLVAELRSLTPDAWPSVHEEGGTSPIGARVAVPWLEFWGVKPGATAIVASYLGRPSLPDDARDSSRQAQRAARAGHDAPRARAISDGTQLEVTWADGAVTVVRIS